MCATMCKCRAAGLPLVVKMHTVSLTLLNKRKSTKKKSKQFLFLTSSELLVVAQL